MILETAHNNKATPDHSVVERRYYDRRHLDSGAAVGSICGQFYHGKGFEL